MIDENGKRVCDLCEERGVDHSELGSEMCHECAKEAGWFDHNQGEWITY
jgi:hypothetical protein